jgi:glycosyltransferase involved in cell wall biosynthesis
MNEEYVLLGWKFWKFWGKKIYMWRNHKKGSLHTRFAVLVSTKVFYTSPDSFTAQFKKAIKMPVGIDVERFKDLKIERRKNSILFIGRIAPVKRVELFVEALKILEDKGISFEASIYGDALEKDKGYFDDIKKKAEGPELVERINFQSGVPNYKTPEIYSKNQIYINLTPSGSFDKTILEASACGCIPVIINGSLEGVFDDNMIASDKAEDIANKIQYWLEADESIKQEWRVKLFNYVLENHSLNALMERLCIIIRK